MLHSLGTQNISDSMRGRDESQRPRPRAAGPRRSRRGSLRRGLRRSLRQMEDDQDTSVGGGSAVDTRDNEVATHESAEYMSSEAHLRNPRSREMGL